jgi:hypothetical protein
MCDFSSHMEGCWVPRRQFTVVYLLSGSPYLQISITTWPELYLSVLGYGWTTKISQRNLWRGHWMKCWRIRGKEFMTVINWVLIFSNILLETLPLQFEVFWLWVNLTLIFTFRCSIPLRLYSQYGKIFVQSSATLLLQTCKSHFLLFI